MNLSTVIVRCVAKLKALPFEVGRESNPRIFTGFVANIY
jgi:hypothetical protein